ncbi:hypothetical protein F3Y22_tig00000656pilonHSYRG00021 [Hibiscus syriacus]|uniref:Uncharacterized protein n=1 Tax=Hibiscus syriacus TaxID=106335 RepID=A0A6A3D6L0_HIBSY|nr:hypothetical protein F3Y22_tig00000656pilonHSYRG00021 [Hibiscus syriacus]
MMNNYSGNLARLADIMAAMLWGVFLPLPKMPLPLLVVDQFSLLLLLGFPVPVPVLVLVPGTTSWLLLEPCREGSILVKWEAASSPWQTHSIESNLNDSLFTAGFGSLEESKRQLSNMGMESGEMDWMIFSRSSTAIW